MLDKLSIIDWAKYGVPQIPNLLLILLNDTDNKIYGSACSDLEELFFPEEFESQQYRGPLTRMMQNDLPRQVVPFLIEILVHTDLPDKHYMLLELLRHFSAYKYLREWVHQDPANPKRIIYDEWTKKLDEEIVKGLSMYETFLESQHSYLRSIAKVLMDTLLDDPTKKKPKY